MKRIFVLFIVVAVILVSLSCLTACPGPTPEKPVVLRVSTPWPPLDPPTVLIQGLADGFNARTGGKYIMEVHPGEALVKVMESVDAVRTGAVEMAGWPIGAFSSLDIRLGAAEVPFLYTNVKADAAAQEFLVPMYNQFMPDKFNQKMLGAFTCMGLELVGNKQVKTMDDWKGLIVQSVSPQASAVIESLGGAAVPSPFVEGYTVLEKKVVDATMVTTMFQLVFKLYEVAKYETLGYFIPASLCVTINMDAWDSLPKDIQNILLDESNKFQRSANDFFIAMYDENNKALAEHGIEVYVLPKAERDKWREVVWPFSEQLIADMGDFGQEVLKVGEKVNSQYPY